MNNELTIFVITQITMAVSMVSIAVFTFLIWWRHRKKMR